MPMQNDFSIPLNDATLQHGSSSAMLECGQEFGQQGIEEERPASPTTIYNPYFTGRPRTPIMAHRPDQLDRQELIRRIKGRDGPRLEPAHEGHGLERPTTFVQSRKRKSPSPRPLLPSPELARSDSWDKNHYASWNTAGIEIERPRSALHKGDFGGEQIPARSRRDLAQQDTRVNIASYPLLATSPVAPWNNNFPLPGLKHQRGIVAPPAVFPRPEDEQYARTRAVSRASLSGSFTYQAPTSPLVHQANAADISDHDDDYLGRPSRSPEKHRRHTFSPHSLQNFPRSATDLDAFQAQANGQVPSIRRENTFPYQAHQPRRSITTIGGSLPQTPIPAARRPSLSEGSPLQYAMVGSYEESILRGRMSSTPSKPLDFMAQIGVLGKGDCKASLKCPPHVMIPFPAVFYSYGPGSSYTADAQPSPYVGLVDLENSQDPNKPRQRSKPRRRPLPATAIQDAIASSRSEADDENSDARIRRHRRQKKKRRSRSPMDIPNGGYRIPSQGQLQIVIKNPNKTAVKLFLVPYDISDMQPGQKTFIRQRSYSAGPVIDMPLNFRNNLGTDRPEAALSAVSDPRDRPVLRYLVHFHICSPSKGRFYLYKSIRVVFANRVPDGKEKLRNEVQLPEPRYSVYNPARESIRKVSDPERARRRLSDVDPPSLFQRSSAAHSHVPQEGFTPPSSFPFRSAYVGDYSSERLPLSFQFPVLPTVESRPASRGTNDRMDSDSTEVFPAGSPPLSPMTASLHSGDDHHSPGSMNFQRANGNGQASVAKTESLLSQRLKDLEMRGQRPAGWE